MFAKSYGAVTLGVDGKIIDVEVDMSLGFPSYDVVGLLDTAVKESKERVRTAIKNAGVKLNPARVMINLAPADLRKDSAGLDLPIAMGLLSAYGIIPAERIQKMLFAAELSLEGELRTVRGVLPMAVAGREAGFEEMVVSPDNAQEALLVDGIRIYAPTSLAALIAFLQGKADISPAVPADNSTEIGDFGEDFADVQGQFQAKRALEIAAAGGHNVLMVGAPGAGKTMLARRLPTILPPMTKQEALDVTKIYSIAGLLKQGSGLIEERPFRSPHHTTSTVAMIGGGSVPRPGEVTLSNHGVLFLDELPEFSKQTLEVLRQPLEDAEVTIARVNATLTFPSRMILVCAMNPCPCGWNGDKDRSCDCTPYEIKRYTRKISGPLLDRIDIHIRVPRVEYKELTAREKAESSAAIRQRVLEARELQRKRLEGYGIYSNAEMGQAVLKETCRMTTEAQALLKQAFDVMQLSARSYARIIKVARTIADLDRREQIEAKHVGEAISLRNDVGLNIE
ncbi:YifB family Mg chelatase-like AAA ATPase [Selenomonas sp. TAMA-11512]|uniref:YifB family Mg chelatase-like AAA ATPase n=1 Tax=Selenomonas sp. TAMA-11512 TaxID=3095337 RepID=UPI00308C86E2|nr:YifB family Mg chelatase-like AAA ATPase [Selenomonas sp. TAMA-11512]